jgi:hypothetical protein
MQIYKNYPNTPPKNQINDKSTLAQNPNIARIVIICTSAEQAILPLSTVPVNTPPTMHQAQQ